MTYDNETRWRRGARRPWIPEVIADRYEVERELGAGAAAVTVAARDRRLGRQVAVKILRPGDEFDSAFSQRFTREARAAASINHPNVVDVYDVGQEGDLLYLVMQFVDGTDLKRVIEREGALPWQRAVEIARGVLAGLTPIHAAGIVHRDVKPQNVLIGTNGEIKVTDFGVAHVERDASLTAAGTTVGTAVYMAPEQAQGNAPSPAADVYAVGVMLYEMVTGRLPFDEPTALATMLAHIQQEPDPPVAPRGREPIPEGIMQVIRQALAKDPRARFRSAAAMQRALEHPGLAMKAPRSSGDTGSPTRVVPAAMPPRSRARSTGAWGIPAAPRYEAPAPESAGRGFGATFAMLLLVLAVVFAAVAGAMWAINERPDLFGGSDGGDGVPTSVPQPTDTPEPTPTPTDEPEQPVVIDPIDEEPAPDPTPTPTPRPPTPTPQPPTPTPQPPTQVIVEQEPTPASTDEEVPQIIEPIDNSTEPAN
ncbi:MAG TPA: serine/threonine-protein kinase [Thermomicrobiales bacterium]|nr:serine/threonine-protein kinase [Thermomicrobiales bacterium]